MAKPKGSEKIGGRKKGTPNKLTSTVKEVFENVFTNLQNNPTNKLESWAKRNPTEFYKLCAKLIPTAIDNKVNGDLTIKVIRD